MPSWTDDLWATSQGRVVTEGKGEPTTENQTYFCHLYFIWS